MRTIHNFNSSLRFGKTIESQLDYYFSKWYSIETVSLEEEKRFGIDRIFTKSDGTKLKIEYKADRWTINTSNIFIELEVSGKPGWSRKTIADIIVYAIVDKLNNVNSVLILTNDFIKSNLSKWEQLPKKHIQNNGFYGIGVLVSLESLENIKILQVK